MEGVFTIDFYKHKSDFQIYWIKFTIIVELKFSICKV